MRRARARDPPRRGGLRCCPRAGGGAGGDSRPRRGFVRSWARPRAELGSGSPSLKSGDKESESPGLLAELVTDDGTVQRLPELMAFSREHDLKIITIADLIAYRQQREQLVQRSYDFAVSTAIGKAQAYGYKTKFEDAEHIALVFGDIQAMESVPVRIHREKLVEDVFGAQSSEHSSNLLNAAMQTPVAIPSKPAALQSESPRRHF